MFMMMMVMIPMIPMTSTSEVQTDTRPVAVIIGRPLVIITVVVGFSSYPSANSDTFAPPTAAESCLLHA
jgi:hypothetical protein